MNMDLWESCTLTHHWYTSKQDKEKRDAQFWERKRALIEEAKGVPSYPTRDRLRWELGNSK